MTLRSWPRHVRYEGLSWPVAHQRLLLKALLLADAIEARQAWTAWRAQLDLDTLDAGSLALMPLLHERLVALKIDEPLLARVRGARRYHWCRNHILLNSSIPALDRAQQVAGSCVVLKGVAVLDRYGDIGLRPLSDIDVLVPTEQAGAVINALYEDGWHFRDGKTLSDFPELRRHWHGYGLSRGRGEVDIHWYSLLEDRSADADSGIWSRANLTEVNGCSCLRPSPTDTLLHIVVHGARFSRVQSVTWVVDAMRLLTHDRQPIDWKLLVDDAQRRHLQIPVREALRFLAEELHVALPEGLLAALSEPEPAWLFWLDHHAFAADPRQLNAWHRSAARVVARLRAGHPLPPDLLRIPARAHQQAGARN